MNNKFSLSLSLSFCLHKFTLDRLLGLGGIKFIRTLRTFVVSIKYLYRVFLDRKVRKVTTETSDLQDLWDHQVCLVHRYVNHSTCHLLNYRVRIPVNRRITRVLFKQGYPGLKGEKGEKGESVSESFDNILHAADGRSKPSRIKSLRIIFSFNSEDEI